VAKSLQAQLGVLLAAPLESKVSGRFFTGGAAAAIAHGAGLKAAAGPADPDSAQAGVTTETMNKVRQDESDYQRISTAHTVAAQGLIAASQSVGHPGGYSILPPSLCLPPLSL
jgi:hypothetical protein